MIPNRHISQHIRILIYSLRQNENRHATEIYIGRKTMDALKDEVNGLILFNIEKGRVTERPMFEGLPIYKVDADEHLRVV